LMWRWDPDTFGSVAPNTNPAGLGVFTYNLRFPGQYSLNESGLFYNYFRTYDPNMGRYIESDPIGLKGGINTYGYSRQNPVSWVDPSGLAACPGGEWSQDFGDFGAYVAFGGYLSKGRVNYTCRSNPSIKCSANVWCVGGGAILGGGVGWNVYGYAVGATDSSNLAGWSGWQVVGSIGAIGLQAPSGGGVSISPGLSGGAGLARIRCYTYQMTCTSGCGH
jgi:RHS repeat-associated protein